MPTVSAVKSNISTEHRVTGLKLASLLGSLTIVLFLSLLDMSILGTVSPFYPKLCGAKF